MVHEASQATVNTLTASVHVLHIGSRQVTLSVYRQLDWVEPPNIIPMGRVNEDKIIIHGQNPRIHAITVVGADADNGSLVKARIGTLERRVDGGFASEWLCPVPHGLCNIYHDRALFDAWSALPLVILAGLK